jgi:ribosome-binding factor A
MLEVRSRRIEEQIKKTLSSLLLKDLKDPRLDAFITILSVKLSKDGRFARVSVSVIGSREQQLAAIRGLQNAGGYIQRRLSKEVKIKYIPHLNFMLDDTTEETVRFVHRLVESERSARGAEETPASEPPGHDSEEEE